MLSTNNIISPQLIPLKEKLYDICDLQISKFTTHTESKAYFASSFQLNQFQIEHRVAKITEKKVGQFVSIWKRNSDGITAPFDASDTVDFICITCIDKNRIGQFIFPKSILIEQGIISHGTKDGKRGIRVYPIWDQINNKQAEKTQQWQLQYFVDLQDLPKAISTASSLFQSEALKN